MIAGQIEAQLRRLGVSLPRRFECGNSQTLLAMVAAGAGWTITTPLLFSRARRFHPELQMHAFPGKRFARRLSVITTADCSQAVYALTNDKIRNALQQHVIAPTMMHAPWLAEQFGLLGTK